VSSFLFIVWWLLIPVGIGIVASRAAARRSGILVFLGIVAIAALFLLLNSAVQTYDVCGLTLAEMRADLSKNCTYATNSIHETFFAHLIMTAFITFATFIGAAFALIGKRGSSA
jgi:cytochrome bd-type quinol oxidase subunit 1